VAAAKVTELVAPAAAAVKPPPPSSSPAVDILCGASIHHRTYTPKNEHRGESGSMCVCVCTCVFSVFSERRFLLMD
jgi:hypothetical protein